MESCGARSTESEGRITECSGVLARVRNGLKKPYIKEPTDIITCKTLPRPYSPLEHALSTLLWDMQYFTSLSLHQVPHFPLPISPQPYPRTLTSFFLPPPCPLFASLIPSPLFDQENGVRTPIPQIQTGTIQRKPLEIPLGRP